MSAEFTHILDSLGWAVLHSIWQGGLAFLFIIIWRAGLRGRSPALRHAGQIMVLIGCMIGFMWTFAAYLGLPNLAAVGGATPSTASVNDASRLLTGWIAPFDPAAAQAGLSLSRITPILACLWALGFAFMSLRYTFAFGQVQQLRTLGVQLPEAHWTQRFRDLARQIGVTDHVRLYVSPNIAGPMTLGLFKPVVLVPVGFLTSLPSDQVEAILRHELAHIRRYDYALNLVQTGVKTVLFYHPAIHIICRWADQDREQACDDLAVRQGRDPMTLARGLAALRLQNQPSLMLAATGNGEDMPLMDRLTRLAGQTPKKGRPEHILMSVLSALLLASVYLGSSSRADAHPVPPAVPDTIITSDSEPPAPPVPLAPPFLLDMDFSQAWTPEAMKEFIDQDKTSYRAFMKDMEDYAADLESFFEISIVIEDDREDYREAYENLEEDIADLFEDRREAIEELYEEQIERMTEEEEDRADLQAVMNAIEEAALNGLKSVERELAFEQSSNIAKIKRKAIADARKVIAQTSTETNTNIALSKTAQARAWANANAIIARSQAATHRSVARAKAAQEQQAKAHAKIDRSRRKNHEQFRDRVMRELLKDGLIKSKNETVFLSHPNNVMSLNGKPMKKGVREKYCDLFDRHGFTDNRSEVTIKPDSLTILTDWKNGQHTTQVTYGTHHSTSEH